MLKANGKTIHIPTPSTTIQANVDLNSLKSTGTYYLGAGCTNAPMEDSGGLTVVVFPAILRSTGDPEYVIQMGLAAMSGRIFMRRYSETVKGWSPWAQVGA